MSMNFIKQFWRDTKGLALIESALVLPLMITLLFGLYDVGQALIINQKLKAATYTASDLITRKSYIDDDDIANAVGGAYMVIDPYNRGRLGIDIAGIEFDENTVWGQLTILELKLLIYLALGDLEATMELVETFLQFNDNTVERGLFYQAMHATLEVALNDDLEIEDYIHSFTRMFGQEVMDAVVGSINGDVMFYGLTPTNMQLEGLDRHQRLIDSYKKLHGARAARAK